MSQITDEANGIVRAAATAMIHHDMNEAHRLLDEHGDVAAAACAMIVVLVRLLADDDDADNDSLVEELWQSLCVGFS